VASVVEKERLWHGIQHVVHDYFVAAAVVPVTARGSSQSADVPAELRPRYSWMRPSLAETAKEPVMAEIEVLLSPTLTVVEELECE
jgi:hypothetical protein